MSVQRYVTKGGKVRYRARVKSHGREVATRVFDRKRDAGAWEEDQTRKLRLGEWFDPRRGRVPLLEIAPGWLDSRRSLKRNSQIVELVAWRQHIEPRFGRIPIAAITTADVSTWVGRLVAAGMAPSTAARYLASLRGLLEYAVQDGRVASNVAARVRPPTAGRVRREGQFLTADDVIALRKACTGSYADVVLVLAFGGLRWGELAGLKVGDRVRVPGEGLRLQRAVMAGSDRGDLFEDSLKNKRSRTVPLVPSLVRVVELWSAGKASGEWLFHSPKGGPLSESNWKRAVGWYDARKLIDRPTLRVHDLRHTCASVWLGAGADPKVVQRILGHASAAMTMDLYGHLIDQNLWQAAEKLGGILGAFDEIDIDETDEPGSESGA